MDLPVQQRMSKGGEGEVDLIESILASIRAQAEVDYNDSIHVADYENAAKDAVNLAAVLRVENFVLKHTPTFKE